MDLLTLIGLAIGTAALLGGNFLEGGSLHDSAQSLGDASAFTDHLSGVGFGDPQLQNSFLLLGFECRDFNFVGMIHELTH